MQSPPPKYQRRLRLQPEKAVLNPLEHDPSDHEEEPAAPAIALAGTCYAKLYTCGKQLQCDRSHRYESGVRTALTGPFGSAPGRLGPVITPIGYSYLSASAGKIRAADHDG